MNDDTFRDVDLPLSHSLVNVQSLWPSSPVEHVVHGLATTSNSVYTSDARGCIARWDYADNVFGKHHDNVGHQETKSHSAPALLLCGHQAQLSTVLPCTRPGAPGSSCLLSIDALGVACLWRESDGFALLRSALPLVPGTAAVQLQGQWLAAIAVQSWNRDNTAGHRSQIELVKMFAGCTLALLDLETLQVVGPPLVPVYTQPLGNGLGFQDKGDVAATEQVLCLHPYRVRGAAVLHGVTDSARLLTWVQDAQEVQRHPPTRLDTAPTLRQRTGRKHGQHVGPLLAASFSADASFLLLLHRSGWLLLRTEEAARKLQPCYTSVMASCSTLCAKLQPGMLLREYAYGAVSNGDATTGAFGIAEQEQLPEGAVPGKLPGSFTLPSRRVTFAPTEHHPDLDDNVSTPEANSAGSGAGPGATAYAGCLLVSSAGTQAKGPLLRSASGVLVQPSGSGTDTMLVWDQAGAAAVLTVDVQTGARVTAVIEPALPDPTVSNNDEQSYSEGNIARAAAEVLWESEDSAARTQCSVLPCLFSVLQSRGLGGCNTHPGTPPSRSSDGGIEPGVIGAPAGAQALGTSTAASSTQPSCLWLARAVPWASQGDSRADVLLLRGSNTTQAEGVAAVPNAVQQAPVSGPDNNAGVVFMSETNLDMGVAEDIENQDGNLASQPGSGHSTGGRHKENAVAAEVDRVQRVYRPGHTDVGWSVHALATGCFSDCWGAAGVPLTSEGVLQESTAHSPLHSRQGDELANTLCLTTFNRCSKQTEAGRKHHSMQPTNVRAHHGLRNQGAMGCWTALGRTTTAICVGGSSAPLAVVQGTDKGFVICSSLSSALQGRATVHHHAQHNGALAHSGSLEEAHHGAVRCLIQAFAGVGGPTELGPAPGRGLSASSGSIATQGEAGVLVVSGGDDGAVRAWQLTAQGSLGEPVLDVHPHAAPVVRLLLPPLGSPAPWSTCLVSIGQDGSCALISLSMRCVNMLLSPGVVSSGSLGDLFAAPLEPAPGSVPQQVFWDVGRGYLGLWYSISVQKATGDQAAEGEVVPEPVMCLWDVYSGVCERRLSGQMVEDALTTMDASRPSGNTRVPWGVRQTLAVDSMLIQDVTYSHTAPAGPPELPTGPQVPPGVVLLGIDAFELLHAEAAAPADAGGLQGLSSGSAATTTAPAPHAYILALALALAGLHCWCMDATTDEQLRDILQCLGLTTDSEAGSQHNVRPHVSDIRQHTAADAVHRQFEYLNVCSTNGQTGLGAERRSSDRISVSQGVLRSAGGSLTLQLPHTIPFNEASNSVSRAELQGCPQASALGRLWRTSRPFVTQRLLSIMALTKRMMAQASLVPEVVLGRCSNLLTFYALRLREVAPEVAVPQLDVLAQHWQAPVASLRDASRALLASSTDPASNGNRFPSEVTAISALTEGNPRKPVVLTSDLVSAFSVQIIVAGAACVFHHRRAADWLLQVTVPAVFVLACRSPGPWSAAACGIMAEGLTSSGAAKWKLCLGRDIAADMKRVLLLCESLSMMAAQQRERAGSSHTGPGASHRGSVEGDRSTAAATVQRYALRQHQAAGSTVADSNGVSHNQPAQESARLQSCRDAAFGLLAAMAVADLPSFLNMLAQRFDENSGVPPTSSTHVTALTALVRVLHTKQGPGALAPFVPMLVDTVCRALDPTALQLKRTCMPGVMTIIRESASLFPFVALHRPTMQVAVGVSMRTPATGPASPSGLPSQTTTFWSALGGEQQQHELENEVVAVYDLETGSKRWSLQRGVPGVPSSSSTGAPAGPLQPSLTLPDTVQCVSMSPAGAMVAAFSPSARCLYVWWLVKNWTNRFARGASVLAPKAIATLQHNGSFRLSSHAALMQAPVGVSGGVGSTDSGAGVQYVDMGYNLMWLDDTTLSLNRHGHEVARTQWPILA